MCALAPAVFGSAAEAPAITYNTTAASRTFVAIGPTVSRVVPAKGTTPVLGTRPNVGLMPTRLCAADGFWIDPPVSSPRPISAKLPSTAVAVPLLLAPGASALSTALYVGPAQLLLARVPSSLNAGMFDLPRMIASASIKRCTTIAFRVGKRSTPPVRELKRRHPAVEGKPTKSIDSLITIGTPASGPSG